MLIKEIFLLLTRSVAVLPAGLTRDYYSPQLLFAAPPIVSSSPSPPSTVTPAMDIILELWDTFVGDRLYSAILPTSLSSSVALPAFVNAASNTSLALFGADKPFVYEPATHLIHLEPSKYAYLSAWPRNNIYRQFTSFFLITWYAIPQRLPWRGIPTWRLTVNL